MCCNTIYELIRAIKPTPPSFVVEFFGSNWKNEPNKLDEVINIHNNLNLVVDNNSIFYLIGTEIDWKNDIMGNRFEFNNPNANGTCGCGNTFSV